MSQPTRRRSKKKASKRRQTRARPAPELPDQVDDEASPAEGERLLTDEEIVNPEREIVLSNGERHLIEPWGMKEGHIILERIEALGPALAKQGESWDPKALLSTAWDEVVDLVALTVDVDRGDMERKPSDGGWTFEDVLLATQAVLDVCIIRADGSGALPLLSSLAGKMTEVAVAAIGPVLARRRASDSKAGATSGANSGSATA